MSFPTTITHYRADGTVRGTACARDPETVAQVMARYPETIAAGGHVVLITPEQNQARYEAHEADVAARVAAGLPLWRPAPFNGPAWERTLAELDAEEEG